MQFLKPLYVDLCGQLEIYEPTRPGAIQVTKASFSWLKLVGQEKIKGEANSTRFR